jgi:hypothetical protein
MLPLFSQDLRAPVRSALALAFPAMTDAWYDIPTCRLLSARCVTLLPGTNPAVILPLRLGSIAPLLKSEAASLRYCKKLALCCFQTLSQLLQCLLQYLFRAYYPASIRKCVPH